MSSQVIKFHKYTVTRQGECHFSAIGRAASKSSANPSDMSVIARIQYSTRLLVAMASST